MIGTLIVNRLNVKGFVMAVTTIVLESNDELRVSLGFAVKLDSETAQLDTVYSALKGIPGSRVEYLDSKKFRADLPILVPQK